MHGGQSAPPSVSIFGTVGRASCSNLRLVLSILRKWILYEPVAAPFLYFSQQSNWFYINVNCKQEEETILFIRNVSLTKNEQTKKHKTVRLNITKLTFIDIALCTRYEYRIQWLRQRQIDVYALLLYERVFCMDIYLIAAAAS